MFGNKQQKEQEIQQVLTAQLEPGEILQAYTIGKISNSNGFTTDSYYVGLTPIRLILQRVKGNQLSDKPVSIRRDIIKTVKPPNFLASALQIDLLADPLTVYIRGGDWPKRAKELVEHFGSGSALPPFDSKTLQQQVNDLYKLSLNATAGKVLESALAVNSALSADPSLLESQAQAKETLWAYRAGGGFLLVTVALNLLLILIVLAFDPALAAQTSLITCVSTLIDVAIGISLIRGQTRYRAFALFRVVAGFIVFGLFVSLSQGAYMDVLSNAAISTAFVIAVTGQSTRTRTWLAIGIYSVGLMILALSFVAAFVTGMMNAL